MAAPDGNTFSSKNNRLLTDTLRRACIQSPDRLRDMCEALLDKAKDGDIPAITFIYDRLEGKPMQQTVISGDKDNPLREVKTIRLIDLTSE